MAKQPRPIRADARRNRERLLAAARDAFAEQGPDAPLDGIAQRAGLGSGTLYRHFPTREALMRAVYWGEIESLCARGRELAASPSPVRALTTWLRFLIEVTDRRGLAAALFARMPDAPTGFIAECHDAIRAAATPLLSRAQEAGAIRPDVAVPELLKLTHAIAWVTDGPEQTDRLLSLLLDGLNTDSARRAVDMPTG
jgi:AcrR family transcriptional regulator